MAILDKKKTGEVEFTAKGKGKERMKE